MTFSTLTNTPANTYSVNNSIITKTQSFKYLGVHFSPNLTWNLHIEHITSKAFKKLGLLKRRLSAANAETKLHTYTTLIRSALEYASIIWHPNSVDLSNQLESVQNKAARFILSSYSSYQSVTVLKRKLHLHNLDTRRRISRLSFFHSMYHSNTVFATTNILLAHHISSRRDHSYKVEPIFARTLKYQNLPFLLSVKEWNDLPEQIVTLTDISSCKTELLMYLDRIDTQQP